MKLYGSVKIAKKIQNNVLKNKICIEVVMLISTSNKNIKRKYKERNTYRTLPKSSLPTSNANLLFYT